MSFIPSEVNACQTWEKFLLVSNNLVNAWEFVILATSSPGNKSLKSHLYSQVIVFSNALAICNHNSAQ